MHLTKQLQSAKQIIRFSIPISASFMVSMISGFFAMLMVANLGEMSLAAAAIAQPTFLTVITTVSMTFYALGILISHGQGLQTSPEEVGKIVKNGLYLALLLFIPSSIIMWHMDKILILFKQAPALIKLTTQYFHYAALTLIPTLWITVITQFFTGIGNPKLVMRLSLLNFPLMVLCSYGFILGKFGLPKLGLGGITCGTFVAQTITCSAVSLYIFINKNYQRYKLFSGPFLLDKAICKTILSLGAPIGLQFGGELAAISVVNYMMGFFGVTALAASQIVSQYTMIAFMIVLGLSQGASILISNAFAKQDMSLIREYFNSMLLIMLGLFALMFLLFTISPLLLMSPFIHGVDAHALISLTQDLFIVGSFMVLADGLRNIFASGLRGLRDSQTPMWFGISSLWLVSVPASYGIGFILHAGPVGLRIGFISGFVVATVLLWRRIQQKINMITTIVNV